MRTEKKLANGNILITWDIIDKLSVRKSGSINKDNYENLIKVDASTNTITIDKEIAEAYGIIVKEVWTWMHMDIL